jgi:hypothetical protein
MLENTPTLLSVFTSYFHVDSKSKRPLLFPPNNKKKKKRTAVIKKKRTRCQYGRKKEKIISFSFLLLCIHINIKLYFFFVSRRLFLFNKERHKLSTHK